MVIDTAWFRGNHPPYASVEATSVEGAPSPAELERATWETIVAKTAIKGDTENPFEVADRRRWTHVRLSIHPDGGLARLRVHGELAAGAHRVAVLRWLDLLPIEHAVQVLGEAGVPPETAEALLRRRPFADGGALPSTVLSTLLGRSGSGIRPRRSW
ncbi:hypothetical protein [Nonomuraea sp. NPDC046570]|uniref:hypothetical protein n=1 Tax=Nonomuraea sp. NPDC046570 TaxID=3155255 RepID=UPI0033D2B956